MSAAPSDPFLTRALADVDRRLAIARRKRGPEKNTRRALTDKEPRARAIETSDPEYALKPLQPMEHCALAIALINGINAPLMMAYVGCTLSAARNAIAQMKRKLRARGIQHADSRAWNNPEGRLQILNKEAATALLRERFK